MALATHKAKTRLSASVALPSKGRLYGEKFTDGKIEVYPFNMQVEQIFGEVGTPMSKFKMALPLMADLRGMDAGEFLGDELFYIMLNSRKLSYGADTKITTTCPHCGQKETHTIKLPDYLKVTPLKEDFKEPYLIKLPCGDEVMVKLLRVNDEIAVERETKIIKKQKGKGTGDPTASVTLAKHIVSVNGVAPKNVAEVLEYLVAIDGPDLVELRSAVTDMRPGIDTTYTITCPSCDEEYQEVFRPTAEFFRPAGRGNGELPQ